MAKERKFKVVSVKEIKSTTSGQKFLAYQTLDQDGNRIDLKFRRGAENVPTERCWIYVYEDKCNVSTKGEYPVLWVETVNRIEPLGIKNNLDDYFGAADDSEASPFEP